MLISRWMKALTLLFISATVLSIPPVEQHVDALEVRPPLRLFDEETIVFHYHRTDGNYANWDLWIWQDGSGGVEFEFNDTDEYGKLLAIPLSTWTNQTSINIIIRPGSWAEQTEDMKVVYSNFPLGTDNARRVFLVDLESNLYPSADEAIGDKINAASFTSLTNIEVITNNLPISFNLFEDGSSIQESTSFFFQTITNGFRINIQLNSSFSPRFDYVYTVRVGFDSGSLRDKSVNLNQLFDSTYFEDNYVYDGDDLGVTLQSSATAFKFWAPTSYQVKLRIYNNGTPVAVSSTLGNDFFVEHDMILGDQGVWATTLNENLAGKYYTYVISNALFTNEEVVDPYARSAGVNGVRGMIVDFAQTNPAGWNQMEIPFHQETELVVYETHVADITSADTWTGNENYRKKFLGLIEPGTTYTENDMTVTTGFDHIKEIGINALQIIPFYDQANDEVNPSFNWGYNPLNFNVLEGAYATNPYDGYNRIREFKEVVLAYANQDIGIIMDVVYNHVFSLAASNFHKIVPQYFFRYKPNGSPSNGSGVGNDAASERLMYSRFIEQSVTFWASEYKLMGFRFDLMGLHDVPTMQRVRASLETVNPNIIVFGEPWDMSGTIPTKPGVVLSNYKNLAQVPGVGGFNDQIRDAIKGSVFTGSNPGWIQKSIPNELEVSRITNGIKGIVSGATTDPKQAVNYVSAHDNHTLFDKLQLSMPANESLWSRMSVQANAMILTAQGLSFLHAGEEMMRSKEISPGVFDHNSYQSSYEINAIRWERKIRYIDEYRRYQELIKLKTTDPLFQFDTATSVSQHVTVIPGSNIDGLTNATIIVQIVKDDRSYLIIHHGAIARFRLEKLNMDLTGYKVAVDTASNLSKNAEVNGQTLIHNFNSLVLVKNASEGPTPTPPSSFNVGLMVTIIALLASAGFITFLTIKKYRKSR